MLGIAKGDIKSLDCSSTTYTDSPANVDLSPHGPPDLVANLLI